MDKAPYSKTLGGAVSECSLCFTHRKLPLEQPCSAREMPACVLPVSSLGRW